MKRISVLTAAVVMLLFGNPCMATTTEAVKLPVPYMAQPDDQTCLPTCLNMVLHWYGRLELTSDTIQALHKRTQYDRYNLPEIVADYGLHALPAWYELGWRREEIEAELRAGRPVILGVNQGRYGHFVLAVGFTADGRVIIHDPTKVSPGYPLGGPYFAAEWRDMLWRGGAMIRPEPFPTTATVSGKPEGTTYPAIMKAGETAEAIIGVRNNGLERWPEGVTLEAIDPWTTEPAGRRSAFFVKGKWLAESRVCKPEPARPEPGELALFRFPIQAPQVVKATTFMEHFGLVDGTGRRFSESYNAGPGDWGLFVRPVGEPKREWKLPLAEEGTEKPLLPWSVKNGSIQADKTTTAPPPGGPVWSLYTPDSDYDVAWVGDSAWKDYAAEAWIYCDYRPELESEGFDRVGLFMHDNGQHRGDTKTVEEVGECIAMMYDSDDGSLRAGDVSNGGVGDFREGGRFRLRESGWHKFGIRCEGTTVTYTLDDQPFATATTDAHPSGDCGVYYKTAFADRAKCRGVRFAGFRAFE